MDIEGKVVLDLGMQTGVSKAGNNWKKREIVIETFGSYPRKVKLTLFGDRADNVKAEIGNSYVFGVDVESREYNGRWYTDVSAFTSREVGEPAPQMGGMPGMAAGAPYNPAPQMGGIPGAAPAAAPASDPFANNDSSDDLPF